MKNKKKIRSSAVSAVAQALQEQEDLAALAKRVGLTPKSLLKKIDQIITVFSL